jgi:hypothetical protein
MYRATSCHRLFPIVAALALALVTAIPTAGAAGEEEQRSGAVVPSELSERSLTGSYVVTAGALAIVIALIVAQRMRNRRAG